MTRKKMPKPIEEDQTTMPEKIVDMVDEPVRETEPVEFVDVPGTEPVPDEKPKEEKPKISIPGPAPFGFTGVCTSKVCLAGNKAGMYVPGDKVRFEPGDYVPVQFKVEEE